LEISFYRQSLVLVAGTNKQKPDTQNKYKVTLRGISTISMNRQKKT